MADLLYKEFLFLQLPTWATFFGVVALVWGLVRDRKEIIRWGLLAFLITGLSGIPLYFNGQDLLNLISQTNIDSARLEDYELDYFTTLIVTLFLSITALMSLIMQKSLKRIPRFFVYLVLTYAVLTMGYLGWRQLVLT